MKVITRETGVRETHDSETQRKKGRGNEGATGSRFKEKEKELKRDRQIQRQHW